MMKFKYAKINDLNNKNEIRAEIERLKKMMVYHNSYQYSLKILMNSMYGVFLNPHFKCFNKFAAETITRQGQDIIKFAEKIVVKYVKEFFLQNKKLHKELNIKIKNENAIKNSNPSIYIDTDSLFFNFNEIYENIEFLGEKKSFEDFILELYEKDLKKYFDFCFEKYAKKFNTKNFLDFELEAIFRSGIWLGKKKYVADCIWKMPGVKFNINEKVVYKGVEIVRSDTPRVIRDNLKDFVNLLLNQEDLNYNILIKKIKFFKEKFKLSKIEDIAIQKTINNYKKYVVDDKINLTLMKACPIHVRAAATYNFLLNKNKKLKNKYHFIKDGDKIKFYYTQNNEVFGFLANEFPYEFAPGVDYDKMFEKTFLIPLNRFIEVIYKKQISSNLYYLNTLF